MSNMIPPVGVAIACGRTKACQKNRHILVSTWTILRFQWGLFSWSLLKKFLTATKQMKVALV